MTKQKMESMSVDELRKVCKENGVKYCTHAGKLNKAQMIEKLYEEIGTETDEDEESVVSETDVTPVVEKETPVVQEEVKNTVEEVKESETKKVDNNYSDLPDPETFFHTRNKKQYIENAEVGTLVAFIDENGKPRTAAIENRSSKREVLKVKTEFGWEFIVPYDKVLWVKRGTKWPNGVYRLLKGWKYANKQNAQ